MSGGLVREQHLRPRGLPSGPPLSVICHCSARRYRPAASAESGGREFLPWTTERRGSGSPGGRDSDAEQLERQSVVPGTGSRRRRDVGRPIQSVNGDGQVAQRCHDLRTGAGADLGAVFIECHITHPVTAILDAPVSTHKSLQVLRTGFCSVSTGDREGYFAAGAMPLSSLVACA